MLSSMLPRHHNAPLSRESSISTFDISTYNEDLSNNPNQDEIIRLHILCDEAEENNMESWNAIRVWIESHQDRGSRRILEDAAHILGDYSTTPLHAACRNCPPVDIIESLLGIAPNTVEMSDSFAWLPLHYACANGASEGVLRVLCEAYSESRIFSDKRGRTPLHFALGNTARRVSPEALELLAVSGAAARQDENGMLPLHYACAYGISREALSVLINADLDSITGIDNKGRTPLHFALGNADRESSPSVVGLLLKRFPAVVDKTDNDGKLPLDLLARQSQRLELDNKDGRKNAEKCLELYLKADPQATATLFTALQALPNFLCEVAVVTPLVQEMLNRKISKRFPTMILILDAYFIILILVCFGFSTKQLNLIVCCKEDPDNSFCCDEKAKIRLKIFVPLLFSGGVYFLLRELVQMISLASLGIFRTWLFDPTNMLDVISILIVFFWSIVMFTLNTSIFGEQLWSVLAISVCILWGLSLSWLRSTFVDFAVFVSGLGYVMRRLTAFIIVMILILVAFSQAFFTIFQETEACYPLLAPMDKSPFCYQWKSLFKVYTMFLGEVSEQDFTSNGAIVMYAIFVLLVVVLLANVLIAIVTDNYGVIKNERAQVVFWNNRLDFVAEIDLISTWFTKATGCSSQSERGDHKSKITYAESTWQHLVELFDVQDQSIFSLAFCRSSILRLVAGLVIPTWLIVGVGTAGVLWPPQVREYVVVQKISKRNSVETLTEQRVHQINELKKEITKLQGEIKSEVSADRKEVERMKSHLVDMNADMIEEVNKIKKVMTAMFDLQTR